ncbi:MAG TPA: TniQ family protein, partial [Oculatellaceae cyanobacterium]
MIPCFPVPLPDELLYSLIARYSDRMQYPDKQSLHQELFADKNATAVVDLPSHLSHLLGVLPPVHGYTVERLIDEHTLLPFYSPFLPTERVNLIREY